MKVDVKKAVLDYWNENKNNFKNRTECAEHLNEVGIAVEGSETRVYLGVPTLKTYLSKKRLDSQTSAR